MKKIDIDNYSEQMNAILAQIDNLQISDNAEISGAAEKLHEIILKRREGGDKLKADNDVLRIGIVGQVKSGKSSFLNSLFFNGENVLPKASTPMTAGLTILSYGEKEEFIVEYFNAKEWEDFEERAKLYDEEIADYKQNTGQTTLSDEEAAQQAKVDESYIVAKELVMKCKNQIHSKIKTVSLQETIPFSGTDGLQQTLEQYVGADGRFTPIVKSLTLHLNDERLKGIQIVDTPGVNDPVISREQRTKEFLRNSHGVFFLSYSGRFFDATDVQFLSNRIGSEGICSVVLIGSKFDTALQQEGEKFKNDLPGAIDRCQRALESQFKNNLKDSDYTGSQPILTWVSAICYAIASKRRENWDSTESHTLSRLQYYFPNMFGKSDNLGKEDKDTLLELSNLDVIRKEYLEGNFVSNKEKIISEKLNAYFATSSSDIADNIEKELKSLTNKLEVLKASDLDSLKAKKEKYTEVINKIGSNIQFIINTVDSQAQIAEKNVLNSIPTSYSGGIPTILVDKTFIRESTFWGKDRGFSVNYDAVDISKLCDKLKDFFTNTIGNLAQQWAKENRTLTESIRNKFNEVIEKAEMNDTTGNFDAEILRNMVEETLNKMQNSSTIDFSELRNRYIFDIAQALQGCDRIHWNKRKISEDAAECEIREEADDNIRKVQKIVQDFTRPFSGECKQKVREAREQSKSVLKGRKKEFLDSITDQSKKFLDELEKQLTDKTQQMSSYETAISVLKQIKEEK